MQNLHFATCPSFFKTTRNFFCFFPTIWVKGVRAVEDERIVDLYWARSEQAVAETAAKYGGYCYTIARNVLADGEDARECVNDTYLAAWNAMPDDRPRRLSAYLGAITRRICIDRWRERSAARRGGGETPLVLEELAQCVPGGETAEAKLEAEELEKAVADFVRTLPDTPRRVFLCRYWYLDPVDDIAARFGFTQSKVKSMLARTRQKLLAHLKKEGLIDDR